MREKNVPCPRATQLSLSQMLPGARPQQSGVNIQGSIKSQGRNGGKHNLTDEPIQVSIDRVLNLKVSMIDVVDGLAINHEGTIRAPGGVGGEDGVVGLNCSCGNRWGWVDGEL